MQEIIEKIINEAVWAPSGDNTQPWQFEIKDNSLLVYCTPEKDNPVLNFHYSGTYISTGAVLENIEIISNHYGYETNFKYLPNNENHKLVAQISFAKSSNIGGDLYSYIRKRHTNRKPYKQTPLTENEKSELLNIKTDGTSIRIIEDKKERHKIGHACSITERIALESKELHRLFFESLVWSIEEEMQKGKGLHVKSLELPPPVLGLFKIIKNWKTAKILNKIGFSRMAAKSNAKIYAESPVLGAIVIKNSSLLDFILVGRVLQRFWLTATKLDMSLQPVTGTVFFFQRLEANDVAIFSPEHIEMIKKGYKEFAEIYKLEKGEFIAMHFRLGHAESASYRSARVAPKMIRS